MDKEVKKKFDELVKCSFCTKARHLPDWNGYEVYLPDNRHLGYVGGRLILIKGKEVRFSTDEEYDQCHDDFFTKNESVEDYQQFIEIDK